MPHEATRPLWGSRVRAPLTDLAVELSSSTEVDLALAAYDVRASRAHLVELARLGLLDPDGRDRLDSALAEIGEAMEGGTFAWSEEHEDVHMNVEAAVRAAAGPELAGQLQAGRSRNEEVVSDERLWLIDAVGRLAGLIGGLQEALIDRAEAHVDTILPAHTHTQPAQPTLLAHHLLAYVEMLHRDRGRLRDAATRADVSPAGSGAAVGSGLAIDREAVAHRLGFSAISANSLDAVADRDYAVELVSACAITLLHLSRLAADLVSWSTPYYRFARIGDGYATGSSMLPNKRNPDIAELIRGRAARAGGDLATVITVQGGLPLGYHRDLQETRAPMQRSVASLELCVAAMTDMLRGVAFDAEAMSSAAVGGHALSTALAERLVRAGVPFRDAHWRVGELVARAEAAGCDLADLPIDQLREALPELAEHDPIIPTLAEAIAAADLPGGTAPNRVRAALADVRERIPPLMTETVVLAYSGGLDTSVAVPWLRETRGAEVVTLTVDVGAGAASEDVLGRALAGGAKEALAVDAREAFVTDFVWPTLQAGARYQGIYPLATAIARPLIARLLVEVAHQAGATSVAHGCTGKGNDQVRFDVAVAALDPSLSVIAPMRVGMGMNRDEELAYARAHGIDVDLGPGSPYSIDLNLWGRSIEAGLLEDPWMAPPEDAFAWTVNPADAPREATELVIGFGNGIPVSLDGHRMDGVALIEEVNRLAGSYGIGRIDHVEDRLVGIKSREIYEAPAAVVLHQAHDALEGLTLSRELLAFKRQVADRFATLAYDGLWFSELARSLRAFVTWTQQHVTGEVRIRCAPGSAAVVGRRSPHSLYDLTLASYGGEDTFDHEAAVGFISIWGLPVRTQAAVRGPFEDPDEQPLLARLSTVRRNGTRTETPASPVPEAVAARAVAPSTTEPARVVSALTAGASFQRHARKADVAAIHRINERFARRGILLSRTPDEIAEQLGTFRVSELDGEVVGIAALRDYGDGLGELRSLAVADSAQGRGMGEMLVRAIVRDARDAGIGRLYVLTANPGYFALHGFVEVAWSDVPELLDADRASGIARRRWNTAMVLSP